MSAILARLQASPVVAMAVMLLVIIAGAIETDIFVPSFPDLKVYFDTNEAMIQLIVGINFLGLCLSSLIYGPMTDAFGRRSTLLIGMSIFLVGSVGCILSNTIETLLIWRFVQGLGTSAAFIVPSAVIFDLFTKERAAKLLGMFSAIITFAMSIAPIIGNYLNNTFGWKSNFIFIVTLSLVALLSILIFMKETLAPEDETPIHLKHIAKNYFKILVSHETVWYLIMICAVCAGYIIYITNLSLIFVDHLGVSKNHYTYHQAAVLLVFAIISSFNGRIINVWGTTRTRMVGLALNITGGFLLLAVALLFTTNPFLITIAMSINAGGFALCNGIIFSDFMHAFPRIKGLASAISNFTRLLFMGLMVALSGVLFNGTIISVAVIIAVLCLITLVSIFFMPKVNES